LKWLQRFWVWLAPVFSLRTHLRAFARGLDLREAKILRETRLFAKQDVRETLHHLFEVEPIPKVLSNSDEHRERQVYDA
jgi:hypothetical protein